ncbi:MAG: GNAT family N-acetyltransferase, partial [Xanthomonadales bacterium]|nr:GNAT family N-acetyltransferase [Xanthomonadales bacterium]
MKIQSLENVSIEDIHRAFTRAFSDYVEPFNLTVEQLQHTLQRRGFNACLSFAAYSGGEIVGFTLNGSGQWNGQATAYDTGTGVHISHRKQGIASRIFEASLPVLKAHGVSQYLLEVIRVNTKAADLYRKFGFSITREFDYWACPGDALELRSGPLPEGISIRPLEGPDWSL